MPSTNKPSVRDWLHSTEGAHEADTQAILQVIDLNLYTTPRPAPGAEDRVPQYAVCGHEWHGLTIIDYALLAEVQEYVWMEVGQTTKQKPS
jgi:hypothetical protein